MDQPGARLMLGHPMTRADKLVRDFHVSFPLLCFQSLEPIHSNPAGETGFREVLGTFLDSPGLLDDCRRHFLLDLAPLRAEPFLRSFERSF